MDSIVLKENLFIPYPLKELSQKLRKEQSTKRKIVDQLLDEYVKSNGEKHSHLNELLIRFTESDLNINNITKEDTKSFQDELENLDKNFVHIDTFLHDLTESEYVEIIKEKFQHSVEGLTQFKTRLYKELLDRDVWEENDTLIFTYCNTLVGLLKKLSMELNHSSIGEALKLIPKLGLILVIYSAVVLAYLKGNLKVDVLIARMSELQSFSDLSMVRTSKKVKNALEKSRKVAIT
jgi:uncharacterized protein YeaO (DUF488 family)